MEHPCYRCQAQIEEGTAFCPHCGAPQIRVVPPEQAGSPPGGEIPGAFPLAPPPLQPPVWQPPGPAYPAGPPPVRWDQAWPGALLTGAGAGLLSAIPMVSVGCCLWLLGAGALAVLLYQRRVPGVLVTPGMGMRLGALAGVFAFAVNAVVTTVSFLLFRTNADFRRSMQEQMEKQIASNPDPKVQEMVQHMMEWMTTPQGSATLLVGVLLVLAVFFVLFCAAGGALGASMFGRRRELR